MIPIPHADKTDVAELARPVDDDEQCDVLPVLLGDDRDDDVADLFDQKLSVLAHDGGHPPAVIHAAAAPVTDRVFWPTWESNALSTQRSFIDDLASRNQPYRLNW
ncbi:hypothetical protein MMAN_26740 [Mycobacterium mantenii]|uniref:Uncharacterized protein n=1 Tax=Mycobacterium mantenii TaxID=560555 RepID=A0ABM7JSM1_MYCNT|nr:hypothetical protein MMAN_26740 [Mycobacterium mantenii]